MSNERRGHIRVATDVPASIVDADAEPVRGTIANFSERGIFLRAAVSPKLHRPVHVQFILKPDHAICRASGHVAWRGAHGIGVYFDEVNDAFQAYVHELATAAESINPGPKRELLDRILGEADVEFA